MNVVYFNVDINNVRHNGKFHNVGKRRNNIVKMTISENNKKIYFK